MRVSGAITILLRNSRLPMGTGVKRGCCFVFEVMNQSPYECGSDRNNSFSELVAGFEKPMGLDDFVKCECAGDCRHKRMARNTIAHKLLHCLKPLIVTDNGRKSEPADSEIPREHLKWGHHRGFRTQGSIKNQCASSCSCLSQS